MPTDTEPAAETLPAQITRDFRRAVHEAPQQAPSDEQARQLAVMRAVRSVADRYGNFRPQDLAKALRRAGYPEDADVYAAAARRGAERRQRQQQTSRTELDAARAGWTSLSELGLAKNTGANDQ